RVISGAVMPRRMWSVAVVACGLFLLGAALDGSAQQEPKKGFDPKQDFDKKFGKGPGFGPGQRRELVAKFDKDGDGRLNTAEREAAREFLKTQGGGKGFKGGPGGKGKGGFGKGGEPAQPGPKVTPAEVKAYPNAGLFDTTVLRTVF